jgi:hypothetical protein
LSRVCRLILVSPRVLVVLVGVMRDWKNSHFSVLGHPSILSDGWESMSLCREQI